MSTATTYPTICKRPIVQMLVEYNRQQTQAVLSNTPTFEVITLPCAHVDVAQNATMRQLWRREPQ